MIKSSFDAVAGPLSPPPLEGVNSLWQGLLRQGWPQSCLYIVATPIGNLADIGLRALWALHCVDYIACEDTRQTQKLLGAYGIAKQCLALHQHNENQQAEQVIEWMQGGARIAYVSDAGTPGISDPGGRLVARVRAEGLRVLPLPGASAVSVLLSAAGVVANGQSEGFRFVGFLSTKSKARAAEVLAFHNEKQALILLEAPHRMPTLAQDLMSFGSRQVTVGRELTKQFEEIDTMPCKELMAWLAQYPERQKGEFSLVLHPSLEQNQPQVACLDLLCDLLHAGLGVNMAVKICTKHTTLARNVLYDAALEYQNQNPS